VAAVGDISFNGGYDQLARTAGAAEVFTAVAAEMRADLLLGNLEAVLVSDRPSDPPWRFCMRGAPEYVPVLRTAGFHVLTLACNHAMDHGWTALEETKQALHRNGIVTAGAGRNLEEARRPASLTVNGSRVAVLAYCSIHVGIHLYATKDEPGIAYADPNHMVQDVRRCRKDHDVVIVCVHWGDEYVRYPKPGQRRLARKLAEAGADLVFGHHPHVLQGWETIGRSAVAYSLGNFVFSDEIWRGKDKSGQAFDWPFILTEDARQSAVFQARLGESGVADIRWAPVYLGKDLRLTGKGMASEIVAQRSRWFRLGWFFNIVWLFPFIGTRIASQYRQNFRGRDLTKLRPRHVRELWSALAHELQQLRGARR
jgi:hypothetical protein